MNKVLAIFFFLLIVVVWSIVKVSLGGGTGGGVFTFIVLAGAICFCRLVWTGKWFVDESNGAKEETNSTMSTNATIVPEIISQEQKKVVDAVYSSREPKQIERSETVNTKLKQKEKLAPTLQSLLYKTLFFIVCTAAIIAIRDRYLRNDILSELGMYIVADILFVASAIPVWLSLLRTGKIGGFWKSKNTWSIMSFCCIVILIAGISYSVYDYSQCMTNGSALRVCSETKGFIIHLRKDCKAIDAKRDEIITYQNVVGRGLDFGSIYFYGEISKTPVCPYCVDQPIW